MAVKPVHPNRNGVWDRVLVDALVAGGVRRAVLCPGGRNGLLAMTLRATPAMSCLLHVDERSAGFLALGMILADGAPTAVCTTSGSAVANLLPALAEAAARGLPLVLLTCDRPLGGRLPGEPQTLPQLSLCAPLARHQLGLPDPLDGSMTLAELQGRLAEVLVGGLAGAEAGPIHIDIPQWGVRCATEDDALDAPALPLPPRPRVGPPSAPADAEVVRAVLRCGGRPGLRGLVLACEDQPLPVASVADLLEATGYPLVADICSGLRRAAPPGLVTTADALAEAGALDLGGVEILVRLGGAPVSPGLGQLVGRLRCPVIRMARHGGADFLTPRAVGLPPPGGGAVALLGASLGRGDPAWATAWRQAEALAAAARAIAAEALEWGETAAVARICAAPGFAALHCANSMSVRHLGLMMPAGCGPARLFSARGANGTDGTLGLLLGEALVAGGPVLALVGDQAFAHDLPALASPLWRRVKGAICVMNNGGGGLFDLTPARRIAGYADTMRNPPRVAMAGIAGAFEMVHRPCSDPAALADALAEAALAEALYLVEIQVPPGTSARDLPRLVTAMSAGVRGAMPDETA